MSKKVIRNSAAISIGALLLGIVLLVAAGSGALLVAFLCLIVGLISGAIGYFGGLVQTARMRRMGWFVGILLLGVIAALIYGLLGPETQVSNEAMPVFLYRASKKTKKTLGF